MTQRLVLRRLREVVQRHGQGLALGIGQQVGLGIVDLTEQARVYSVRAMVSRATEAMLVS